MGAGQWRQFEFIAAAERKPYNRASPGGKQANRPVGRLKCTPSAYGTSPGGGGLLYASLSANLSRSFYSNGVSPPSGHCYLDKRIHLNTCQKRHVFFSALKN